MALHSLLVLPNQGELTFIIEIKLFDFFFLTAPLQKKQNKTKNGILDY